MSSLVSLVGNDGPMQLGSRGVDVRTLQLALSQAGYRVDITQGQFTSDTEYWVKQFQRQHGLTVDGIVGKQTAQVLDDPHTDIVATATPLMHSSGFPHDDTASLIGFYGQPEDVESNLVNVPTPWPLTYEGSPWPHPIRFHKKCASAYAELFDRIWIAAGKDSSSPILQHVSRFSGSYVPRNVRGSSRLSCHAFGAALDCDANRLGMTYSDVSETVMPQEVVDAIRAVNLYWGGWYNSRKDPMHIQAAHE